MVVPGSDGEGGGGSESGDPDNPAGLVNRDWKELKASPSEGRWAVTLNEVKAESLPCVLTTHAMSRARGCCGCCGAGARVPQRDSASIGRPCCYVFLGQQRTKRILHTMNAAGYKRHEKWLPQCIGKRARFT